MAIGAYNTDYYLAGTVTKSRMGVLGGEEELHELCSGDHDQFRRKTNPYFAAHESEIQKAKEQRETAEAYRLARSINQHRDRVQLSGDEDQQLLQAQQLSKRARVSNALSH